MIKPPIHNSELNMFLLMVVSCCHIARAWLQFVQVSNSRVGTLHKDAFKGEIWWLNSKLIASHISKHWYISVLAANKNWANTKTPNTTWKKNKSVHAFPHQYKLKQMISDIRYLPSTWFSAMFQDKWARRGSEKRSGRDPNGQLSFVCPWLSAK